MRTDAWLKAAEGAKEAKAMTFAAESQRRPRERQAEGLKRELDHRVSNNLQLMLSLLNLQIADTLSEEARAALLVASTRLRSLALVNELALAAGGGSVDAFDLARGFAASMTDPASSPVSRRIALSISGASVQLDVDEALNIALIASEFLVDAVGIGETKNEESLSFVAVTWGAPDEKGRVRLDIEAQGRDRPSEGPSYEGTRFMEALAVDIGAAISFERGASSSRLSLFF